MFLAFIIENTTKWPRAVSPIIVWATILVNTISIIKVVLNRYLFGIKKSSNDSYTKLFILWKFPNNFLLHNKKSKYGTNLSCEYFSRSSSSLRFSFSIFNLSSFSLNQIQWYESYDFNRTGINRNCLIIFLSALLILLKALAAIWMPYQPTKIFEQKPYFQKIFII